MPAVTHTPTGLSATVSRLAIAQARERDLAVNFVVREEHLWSERVICREVWANWTAWAYPVANPLPR